MRCGLLDSRMLVPLTAQSHGTTPDRRAIAAPEREHARFGTSVSAQPSATGGGESVVPARAVALAVKEPLLLAATQHRAEDHFACGLRAEERDLAGGAPIAK